MKENNDNILGDITFPSSNQSNYQNRVESQYINEIIKNIDKMKNSIRQLFNNKPNNKLYKNEFQNCLDNNLFVPIFYKTKRYNKEFNISKKINLGNDETFPKKKEKEEFNSFKDSKNIIINNNNNDNLDNIQANQNNNISSKINVQNIILYNNNLDQISSKISQGEFLRKKRNIDKENETNIIKGLYNEIKNIYNKYNNNNNQEENNHIIIYTHQSGYFDKQETIVIKGQPVSVLYLKRGIITSIFSIKENITYDDEDDIKSILEQLKSDFEQLIKD